MDIRSFAAVVPKTVPKYVSGAWFVFDRSDELVACGRTVDLHRMFKGHELSPKIRSGDLILRVKGYDSTFRRQQADELIKSLRSDSQKWK